MKEAVEYAVEAAEAEGVAISAGIELEVCQKDGI